MSEKKRTVLQEVRDRIETLTEERAAQLAEIRENQSRAQEQLTAAQAALKDATESLDLDAYAKAEQDQITAQRKLAMYSGRLAQITRQELVTEEESDQTVDRLLQYEREITEEFQTAAKEHLAALAELCEGYRKEVSETEWTIENWGRSIRANRRTFGRTRRKDPETGEWTDRAEHPVPIHMTPYLGCTLSQRVKTFIEDIATIKD